MTTFWVLENLYKERYNAAMLRADTSKNTFDLKNIRANADRWSKPGYAAENLKISGSTAVIGIEGVLLSSASYIDDIYAEVFGETYSTYPGIAAQMEAANLNPAVENILLAVNSPGGHAEGVELAANAIAKSKKPTKACVMGLAASGGYWLASQADEIVAMSDMSFVGSVGVAVDILDTTELEKKLGISRYSITSTGAPKKRVERHSDEYKEDIREELDVIHDVFVDAVASGRSKALGRNVTATEVNANYGRGGMLNVNQALAAGMIDAVEKKTAKENTMADENKTTSEEYIAQGVQQERARVESLLPWMETDSSRVLQAISSGESVTPTLLKELSAKAKAAAVVTEADAATAMLDQYKKDNPDPVSAVSTAVPVTDDKGGDISSYKTELYQHLKISNKGE